MSARVNNVRTDNGRSLFTVGNTEVEAKFLFACDGVKSSIRGSLFGQGQEVEPAYSGATTLMGCSSYPGSEGIKFATSQEGVHAVFFNTAPNEQIWQIFFPTPERPETWRPLTEAEGKQECNDLMAQMLLAGWDDNFLAPLSNARDVIRVGLRARPPIQHWFHGHVVLLGDACHPPVPYIGQGAMMALEVTRQRFFLYSLDLFEWGGD